MSAPGRRWLELAVRCTSAGDRDALLADALLALGGRAVEERRGWYVTCLEEPGDPDLLIDRVRAELSSVPGLDGVEVRADWRDDEAWSQTWKRGLALRRVTDRLVVRPSWVEPVGIAADDIVIVLDPGMAFGTAEHGTTRGCLRLMDGAVAAGDRVLDVGAGSGILAVAAARLGASEVVAVEGDALACEAMVENLARNGVDDRVRVERIWADLDALRVLGAFSGVAANLERGLLLPLLPGLVGAVHPGGWLIVSGIVEEEWAEVEARVREAGVRPEETIADDGWRSGRFRRPA